MVFPGFCGVRFLDSGDLDVSTEAGQLQLQTSVGARGHRGPVAQHRDDGGRAGKLSDRRAGSVARATALALCSSDAMTLIST